MDGVTNMGLFGNLFGPKISPEESARALGKARDKIWFCEVDKAFPFLGDAQRAHLRPAVALAYESLLVRLQGRDRVRAALRLAEKAVAMDGKCFEAVAAQTLATMGDNRLVPGIELWLTTEALVPFDAEGHHLRLVIYIVVTNTMIHGVDNGDGVTVTVDDGDPITRGAVRLLDGRPGLASSDFADRSDSSFGLLGAGLASWRFAARQRILRMERGTPFEESSEYTSSLENLGAALEVASGFPSGNRFRVRDSVQVLHDELKRWAGGDPRL
jgi:hypothetical protein